MSKLEEINNELIELRKKQTSLIKEMEKAMLAFCKKEYEGKLIVGGDKEFKIRKKRIEVIRKNVLPRCFFIIGVFFSL